MPFSNNNYNPSLILLFPIRRFVLEESLGLLLGVFSYEPNSPINAIAYLKEIALRIVIALEMNIRTRVI